MVATVVTQHPSRHDDRRDATRSLLGFVGLVLTFVLGFETPNTVLFATSAALTFAAPLVVLGHCGHSYPHGCREVHLDTGFDQRRSVVGNV